ncbi:hypothetical protein [Marinomonas mediterranea]|uniref:Secreted protein n=1 Tax=Marinomonas mediterranea (strain ATCC 700492 / JCM 21426 / NBRC 103028 / MMB-1) TaxID=717774 RepID=F2JYX0_MARM1|nr:hypothetical protein [Marinomonas mediterranea]ADZ90835.1 hypothetical protein Marme_1571 [Marinomonas mediterranea MMB-1]WCN08885.1 hypothetical protein GV055_08110 [Marinomonas mediterranea]WCN12919.1 hypothetical protein GV054_07835 [Marinomonas mediterranea]WCN16988.1 hypothetical protein GV053_07985 [Marinomonas mediterranea MMB-1]
MKLFKKWSLVAVIMGLSMSAYAEDSCTPKLTKYIESLTKNTKNQYVSAKQRETSQNLLNKIARLKSDTRNSDCAVFDKMFP